MNKLLSISLILLFYCFGCSFSYVAKQGFYQFKMLSSSTLIEHALRDSNLDNNSRKKLKLILDIRKFAKNQIFLDIHNNYKDVSLGFNPVMYNVSASYPLSFTSYTWWFPIIGHVPYKGFFDEKDADLEKQRLEKLGLEVSKGQIGGYSTLGFFADPVWPSMLKSSDYDLVDLIIHELVHSTVYIPGNTNFNETLASFIAKEGTKKYFAHDALKIQKNYEEKETYHRFFYELYSELDKTYKSPSSKEEKLQKKAQIIAHYKKKSFEVFPNNKFVWEKINNPFLMSFKRYNLDDKVLNELFLLLNKDFSLFLAEIKQLKRTTKPVLALQNRIKELLPKEAK